MVFLVVATEELQESLWCGLLVHPVDRKVTLNQVPAMTIWTESICFQGLAPNACLVIWPCLRDIWYLGTFRWWKMAGLSILVAEQFERTLSVSSPLCPYSEQTNRAHSCCLSSLSSNDLPTIYMASHMSESKTTSSNACFFPLPTSALVLSHHVNACIPGSALQTHVPSDCLIAVMSMYVCHCLVPVQKSILALIRWLNVQASIGVWWLVDDAISPLDDTWPPCSRMRISAFSCCVHSSSTQLQEMPSSPATSLWHSAPWVTYSSPMPTNRALQCGCCHSCPRRAARSVLFMPSHRHFFHCVGHFWLPPWILIWMAPPVLRLVLSGFLIEIAGYWSTIRSVLVLCSDEVDFNKWSSKMASLLNVLGEDFSACSKAIPSRIYTPEDGTTSTASAFPSRMWSRVAFPVFAGAPSGVAIDHGRGPSGYFNTSCMFIRLCCAMTTILPNKPLSALMMISFSAALIFLDLTRFWKVCSLTFDSGANKSTSLVCSILSMKVVNASLPFWSAVSKWSAMSSAAFTADAMIESGFEWVLLSHNGVLDFVDIIFILLHAWHTGILVLLAFSIVETCSFSESLQGLGSVVSCQNLTLYCTSVKTHPSTQNKILNNWLAVPVFLFGHSRSFCRHRVVIWISTQHPCQQIVHQIRDVYVVLDKVFRCWWPCHLIRLQTVMSTAQITCAHLMIWWTLLWVVSSTDACSVALVISVATTIVQKYEDTYIEYFFGMSQRNFADVRGDV